MMFIFGPQTGPIPLLELDSNFALLIPRGYIDGLNISATEAAASFSVSAGYAVDSGSVVVMPLASAMSKTTAAWVAGSGNGGLDSGAIAANTWYHVFLIYRGDTGAVDVLYSVSAVSPVLPAAYTRARRIGSVKTLVTSATFMGLVQDGDYFQWAVPPRNGTDHPSDYNVTNPGTTAVAATLNVPTGVNVIAQVNCNVFNDDAANRVSFYLSDLATSATGLPDTVPGVPSQISNLKNAAGFAQTGAASVLVRTSTVAQVRFRIDFSGANTNVKLLTSGWFDKRGKNA